MINSFGRIYFCLCFDIKRNLICWPWYGATFFIISFSSGFYLKWIYYYVYSSKLYTMWMFYLNCYIKLNHSIFFRKLLKHMLTLTINSKISRIKRRYSSLLTHFYQSRNHKLKYFISDNNIECNQNTCICLGLYPFILVQLFLYHIFCSATACLCLGKHGG